MANTFKIKKFIIVAQPLLFLREPFFSAGKQVRGSLIENVDTKLHGEAQSYTKIYFSPSPF